MLVAIGTFAVGYVPISGPTYVPGVHIVLGVPCEVVEGGWGWIGRMDDPGVLWDVRDTAFFDTTCEDPRKVE